MFIPFLKGLVPWLLSIFVKKAAEEVVEKLTEDTKPKCDEKSAEG